MALEYKFGRSTSGTTGVKDIAHIWELGEFIGFSVAFGHLICIISVWRVGGGAYLSELINVPITPQRLPSAAAVVVVDLSKVCADGCALTSLPLTPWFVSIRCCCCC